LKKNQGEEGTLREKDHIMGNCKKMKKEGAGVLASGEVLIHTDARLSQTGSVSDRRENKTERGDSETGKGGGGKVTDGD